MYIGLYVFFGSLCGWAVALFVITRLPALWSSMAATIAQLMMQRSVPPANPTILAEWSAFSLLGFAGFLFVHYCCRVAGRDGLLPGRNLWLWTIIHQVSILLYLASVALPEDISWQGVVFGCGVFLLGWLPYFAMALWAFRKCASELSH